MKMNDTYTNILKDINVSTANQILDFQLSNFFEHFEKDGVNFNPKRFAPILLVGSPGIGKSTIINELAKKHGIELIDIRLSQLDPVDLRGVPSVNQNEKITVWNRPDFFPSPDKAKGILFLDELTGARPDIQLAAYQLILDRKIGDYSLPNGWFIIAAGNKSGDEAITCKMSSALSNRFMHLNVFSSASDWLKWARKNNVHELVTKYISSHKNSLNPKLKDLKEDEDEDFSYIENAFPTPRSWERVSDLLNCVSPDFISGNKEMFGNMVCGLIGYNEGKKFTWFVFEHSIQDDTLRMLNGEIAIKVPDENDIDKQIEFGNSATMHILNDSTTEKFDNYLKILSALKPSPRTVALYTYMDLNNKNIQDSGKRLEEKKKVVTEQYLNKMETFLSSKEIDNFLNKFGDVNLNNFYLKKES